MLFIAYTAHSALLYTNIDTEVSLINQSATVGCNKSSRENVCRHSRRRGGRFRRQRRAQRWHGRHRLRECVRWGDGK